MSLLNAFTVDVEEHFQVSAFEKYVPRSRWDALESRVLVNTHRVLRLLDEHGVRATFFVLGWVARRYPQLVRDIAADGHTIGSHSYWHRLIYDQTPEDFRSDLLRSRDVLEQILGQAVRSYRAPSFSITRRCRWALDILAEENFLIDASIFPVHHDRYGLPDAEPTIHKLQCKTGAIWEFPSTVFPIAGRNVPIGGGGYFRLYPLPWTLYCLRHINDRLLRPFMFYIHPWELDPEQPRLRCKSLLSVFRHRVNLSGTEAKLKTLLRTFRFSCLEEVIRQHTGLDLTGDVPAALHCAPLHLPR